MNLIWQPEVYVTGRQTIDSEEVRRFLRDHGIPDWSSDGSDAEVLCEIGGRLCYMSFKNPRPGGNKAYLDHILESGHGSVIEHSVWNLIVTGVSRSLSHELVRHRAGMSPSQLSQRYIDESDCSFVVPPELVEEVRACENGSAVYDDGTWTDGYVWKDSIRYSLTAYTALADRLYKKIETRKKMEYLQSPACAGVTSGNPAFLDPTPDGKREIRKTARQAARSVLPNCTETKLFLTVNGRAMRNILEQRGSRHADAEIRRLVNQLLDIFQKEAPNLFGDYRRVPLPDGTFEIQTDHRKV